MDPLIESYVNDLRRERRKLQKPVVYGTPTRADMRALMAHNKRMLQLVEAGEHLQFAQRMDRLGKPTRLVRQVLKSAQRCLYPLDREQRSRENMECWILDAESNVERKPKRTKRDLYNDYDW